MDILPAETKYDRVGFYAKNLNTGKTITHNSTKLFHMASTRKLAIAVLVSHLYILSELADYKLSAKDWRPGSGLLSLQMVYTGMMIKYDDLLRLMLQHSDNTATDILMNLVGKENITPFLRKIGLDKMRLDRDSMQIKKDYDGIANFGHLVQKSYLDQISYLEAQTYISEHDLIQARKDYLDDPQDTTSPEDMGILLELIANNFPEIEYYMKFNIFSYNRIIKLVPNTVNVAHKGGTLGENDYAITNDIAILELPNDQKIIMAIFVNSETSTLEFREDLISKIALELYTELK